MPFYCAFYFRGDFGFNGALSVDRNGKKFDISADCLYAPAKRRRISAGTMLPSRENEIILLFLAASLSLEEPADRKDYRVLLDSS